MPGAMTDAQYIKMATDQVASAQSLAIKQAIFDTAVLALDLLLRSQIMGYQTEILDDILDLAEETQAHWRRYRPYEQALVNDVMNYPLYTPQYTAITNQYNSLVEDSFAANHDDYLDYLQDTCMPGQTICEDLLWDNALALQRVDAQAYGMRFEEFSRFTEDAIRFSRQKTVAGLGRGAVAGSLSTMDMIRQGAGRDIGLSIFSTLANYFRPVETRPVAAPQPPTPVLTHKIVVQQPSSTTASTPATPTGVEIPPTEPIKTTTVSVEDDIPPAHALSNSSESNSDDNRSSQTRNFGFLGR
jgi:hypothetical protein